MLSKWPIPNRLSGTIAPGRGLWIRRVLVGLRPPSARAQEGQLEARQHAMCCRAFTYYARSRFGKQAGSSSAELPDAGRKRGLRARNAESGEVSYRADGGTPPRCMAGDGIRPGTKVADGGRPHSVPTLLARDACITVGSSSLPTESSNGAVER